MFMYARAAVNFFFISINLQRSMLNSIKMKYARIKGARRGNICIWRRRICLRALHKSSKKEARRRRLFDIKAVKMGLGTAATPEL
jgi:hypothetical protein